MQLRSMGIFFLRIALTDRGTGTVLPHNMFLFAHNMIFPFRDDRNIYLINV